VLRDLFCDANDGCDIDCLHSPAVLSQVLLRLALLAFEFYSFVATQDAQSLMHSHKLACHESSRMIGVWYRLLSRLMICGAYVI
jgi:hypothetical protein